MKKNTRRCEFFKRLTRDLRPRMAVLGNASERIRVRLVENVRAGANGVAGMGMRERERASGLSVADGQ